MLLKVDINSEGVTENIRFVDFSPYEDFVPSAIKYVSETKYKKYNDTYRLVHVKGHLLLVKFKVHKNS
ncbi:hypothetical protein [Microbulbifer sp. JMSA003]|uniref:hypothetical protein n=1 Tax=Microbulbifer sp. JMSA003 TaxID=3243369 RepID=UPI0040396492